MIPTGIALVLNPPRVLSCDFDNDGLRNVVDLDQMCGVGDIIAGVSTDNGSNTPEFVVAACRDMAAPLHDVRAERIVWIFDVMWPEALAFCQFGVSAAGTC